MPPSQLTCKQLEPGDLLLKLNAGSKVNVIIEAMQSLTGAEFPSVVHAGVLFDPHYIIEASGVGIHANDLRVTNAGLEYIVYRCTTRSIAAGAGTYAKILLDIHAEHHSVQYNLLGAVKSLFSGAGKASTRSEMDARLDAMLAGKNRPNFCSQFVVAVFQFAAEQNGRGASTVFEAFDAVPPSRLLSMLRRTQSFRQVGYLAANAR
jgi:hypothetical protein